MSDPGWFKLYSKLPVWAQNMSCSAAGIKMRQARYNREFWRALEFLESSQWWSLEELSQYQDEQLRKQIHHAYESVPYYRDEFDRLSLKPDDIKTTADLEKLPILTKQTVRDRYEDLLSRGWQSQRGLRHRTGGTTGSALRLMVDIDADQWYWATVWRHRRRFGVDVRDPFITLAGRSVVPLTHMGPPFWRRNWPMHQTYVSVHHLTKQNMAPLVEYLQRRRVAYYSGYPSALYILASYLLENDIRLRHRPRVAFSGSETLHDYQREAMASAFECDVAQYYGMTEPGVKMSECEHHSCHVDMEQGILELLPVESESSSSQRIISTDIRNRLMPLIRYDTGDLATPAESQICPCGRQSPIVASIDGRVESYIITPDGRQLGRLDFLFKKSDWIAEAQLVQERIDHVIIRVVRRGTHSAADEALLIEDFRRYAGNQVSIEVVYVDAIPREANGKFRQIVSKVINSKSADSTSCDKTQKGVRSDD